MTEQIYTAAEIGQAGEIHSIAFYNHGSAITRNIDLYLAHTDKDTFSTMTEWMPMTPADLVFSGNIDFLEWDWTVIEFSTPFAYNGTDNLMVLTNDNTGTIDDYRTFGVYSAPKQSLGVYNNNDNFDPANPSAGSYVGKKNHIQLGFFPTQCPGPTNITVSDITQHTATLAWTDNGGATAWDICLNGDEANAFTVTTNPYTLTGLSGETDYTVKIRTVCGDNGTSMWTGAKSFTTSALPCPVPTNFMVTNISNTSATLSWSENDISAEWQICVNDDEDNIIDVTTNSYTITDLTSEASYTVKVRANCDGESVWSVWSNESSFTTGTELVQIGTGTDTHSWLPTNTGRLYTLSQQIYTTAEIGQSGDIYSVAFYNTGDTTTRNLDLYMVHTNKNSLVSNDDWTAVTTADRVFSGSVHFQADDWTVINFSTPFSYNGTDNLLLTVDDNTGNGDYDIRDFLVFSTQIPSQAIVVFNNNNSTTNYDPADPSEYSGSRWSIKNQIQLSFVPDTSVISSYVHVEGETAVCQGNTTTLTATTDVEATYQWNTGATTQSIIVGSGSYSVTVTSSTGHELSGAVIVTEKETYDVDDYHSICSSELPIEWNGVTFENADEQEVTLQAANGCDSVVRLHLTVFYPENEVLELSACGSYTWTANGQTYYVSGEYTYAHPDTHGCTQIDTLRLTILQGSSAVLMNTICSSELPYVWNGVTFTEAGMQTATITAANGCDSVVTMVLVVNTPVTSTTSATECGSYTWTANGQTYTESGVYTYSHQDANGCTQVDTLYLTLHYATTSEFIIETSDSCYEWNGQNYCESGDYMQILETVAGCDSVVTLHLTTSVGIDDYELGAIYLIPNPAKNVCRINGLETAPVSVELYDMNGKLIRRINTAEFDVSTLSTGIYMVRVNTGNRVVNLKMVKQ